MNLNDDRTAVPPVCNGCGLAIKDAAYQLFSGYPYHMNCLPPGFTRTKVPPFAETPGGDTWMGKPINDMTAEELRVALRRCAREMMR